MLQPEYTCVQHKTIQNPCAVLQEIDTTLKKITTLEEDIKIKTHHNRWNPLYIGIGIGATALCAISLVVLSLIVSMLTLPGFVFLVLMLDIIPLCGIGMIAAPIATFCVVTTKSLQNEKS